MLVVVIAVQMVGVAVVQVVDVALVLDGDVAAGRPVQVVVIGMGRVGGGHGSASFRRRRRANTTRIFFYEFDVCLCESAARGGYRRR